MSPAAVVDVEVVAMVLVLNGKSPERLNLIISDLRRLRSASDMVLGDPEASEFIVVVASEEDVAVPDKPSAVRTTLTAPPWPLVVFAEHATDARGGGRMTVE